MIQLLILLERNIIRPDLVIYLQADTDVLMKNIAKKEEGIWRGMLHGNILMH